MMLLVFRVLASVRYCEKYVGVDELSICNIVMEIKLIGCGWIKNSEIESDEGNFIHMDTVKRVSCVI